MKTIVDLLHDVKFCVEEGDIANASIKVELVLDLITKGYDLDDNLENLSNKGNTSISELPTVDDEEG